jgi:hypothetical protein
MNTNPAVKIAILREYFATRRGCGHTRAMLQGAMNVERVSVLIPSNSFRGYIEDKLRGKKVTFVSWQGIEGLGASSNPLVIDNAATFLILGDALDEIRKLRSEISLLRAMIDDYKALSAFAPADSSHRGQSARPR